MKPTDETKYSVSSSSAKAGKGTNRDDWATIRVPRIPKPRLHAGGIKGTRLQAIGLVAALLISMAAGFVGGLVGARHDDSVGSVSLSDQKKVVTSESQLISQIAKNLGPSVVSVDVISQSQDSQTTSPLDSLFGLGGGTDSGQQESAGTGIIIASDGLIVTNRHVVPAGTTSVSVTLSDGTQLDNVKVVGRTKDTDSLDIAFLKIADAKGHKLVPAAIGDSSQSQVGDAVVAIGNALGQFQNTVTSGILSGFGRSVQAGDASGSSSENLEDLFQTDAAINEGNSGGPLVNLNGQVIGINTAVASNSQSVGFAIPMNDVKGLINQVEKTGKLVRPYVGVRYTLVTADVAKKYNLSVQKGALIVPSADSATPSVISGSPAEKAGLQEGDVIVKIGTVTIDQTHSITSAIGQHDVGDQVDFTILRDGKTIHKTVTLEAQPDS